MAFAVQSEDILLDSVAGARMLPEELVQLPPEDARKPEQEHTWRSFLQRRARQYLIFNGHYLQVHDSASRRSEPAVFNLAFLDPQSLQRTRRPYGWLGASLTSMLAGTTTWWLEFGGVGAALLALSVLLLIRFLRGCRDERIFLSRYGRVPLFSVCIGGLRRARAEQFVELLSERIDGAMAILPGGKQRMAAEVAEHRRLREAGTISASYYEKAKKRIFVSFRL